MGNETSILSETTNGIYHLLREKILSFEMEPGDALSENTLADQTQVSRAPVRDAMARLTEEGYVVVYPQRGSIVTHLDPQRIRQAVFLRVTLECTIVELLCRRGLTNAEIDSLEEMLERQRLLSNAEMATQMMTEDAQMHSLLYAFADRADAEDIMRPLGSDLLRVHYLQLHTFSYSRRVQLSAMAGWENYLLEHRMLVDAIKKHDVEAACLIAVNHLNGVLWNADNLQKIFPHYFMRA